MRSKSTPVTPMFISIVNQDSEEIVINVGYRQTRIIVNKFLGSGFLKNYGKNHWQSSEFPFEVSIV
ncbi:hypothetical protein PBCVMA1E_123R [Paramecium bursaria Chlorella virus MA1E]|nr:hypothetical protein PBCVMA1E_123R [Paramecium bursaria Chlorella virus MA1E]